MKNPSNAIIVHTLHAPKGEFPVWQHPEDGYINVTQMCQAVGKKFKHWRENKDSERYLQAVSRSVGIPADRLINIVSKGPNAQRGTWTHYRVALRIAQWCSPEVAAQVDEWLEAWFKGELATNMTGAQAIRMLMHRSPVPPPTVYPGDFYSHLERLYGIKYDEKKGAPHTIYAAKIQYALIVSRLPLEVRVEMDRVNPADDGGRRKYKLGQFMKSDLLVIYEKLVDDCVWAMSLCHSGNMFQDRINFERTWNMLHPPLDAKQLPLLTPNLLLDSGDN